MEKYIEDEREKSFALTSTHSECNQYQCSLKNFFWESFQTQLHTIFDEKVFFRRARVREMNVMWDENGG